MRRGLLIALFTICGLTLTIRTASGNGFENRYRLTTAEDADQYAATYEREIKPYFSAGRYGWFEGVGGVMIRYRYIPYPGPGPEKGAIVISSGRTEGMVIYQELIYDLGRQGYAVYIHDHRGQGFSERLTDDPQKSHVDSFDDYVKDLEKFVTDKVKPAGHRNLYLLAHSMGGGIASIYLEDARHRGIFKAAALVSPMHQAQMRLAGKDRIESVCKVSGWLENVFISDRYAAGQKGYVRATSDRELTESDVRYQSTRRIYDHFSATVVGGVTHRWVHEVCAAGEQARRDAAQIEIPVLLVQAGNDVVVQNNAQNEFCATMNKKHPRQCTLFPIAGGNHALFIEHDRYRLPTLTRVLDFFNEHRN